LKKTFKLRFQGFDPGEKLFEELLSDKEHTLPTYHPKIQIAQIDNQSFGEITTALQDLKKALREGDKALMVTYLKSIVPEFISNNSVYEELDGLELN
jgi:FlaA1/EpsC-like NDP-sugar epimerase